LLSALNKEKGKHSAPPFFSRLDDPGITMVMVTHDVSLKQFADRVIWMRDGLIQKIECVSAEQRAECMSRLDEKLAAGAATQVLETEYRNPDFYAPYQFAVHREQHRLREKALGLSES
jgi:energy-coupling factor transporter ATP-binding protein EcfA2